MTMVLAPPAGVQPIESVRWRERVRVHGRVTSLRVVPWVGTSPVLECTINDGTGGVVLVFLGRERIGGLVLGRWVTAEGMVVVARHRLVLMNPVYALLP